MAHHGPGVDAGDPDDALADEFVFQRAGGAPVGRARRRVAHRVTGDPDPLPRLSESSPFQPVLPICGAVATTI